MQESRSNSTVLLQAQLTPQAPTFPLVKANDMAEPKVKNWGQSEEWGPII